MSIFEENVTVVSKMYVNVSVTQI